MTFRRAISLLALGAILGGGLAAWQFWSRRPPPTVEQQIGRRLVTIDTTNPIIDLTLRISDSGIGLAETAAYHLRDALAVLAKNGIIDGRPVTVRFIGNLVDDFGRRTEEDLFVMRVAPDDLAKVDWAAIDNTRLALLARFGGVHPAVARDLRAWCNRQGDRIFPTCLGVVAVCVQKRIC